MNAPKKVSETWFRLLLIAAVAIALVPLAAPLTGSGPSDPNELADASNPLAAHDSTRNAPEVGAGKHLLDIAASAGSLRVFGGVMQAASDAGLLQGGGPFTVFMPIDEAFSSMTEEQLSLMLNDSDALRSFVETYIVPGRVSATDLMAQTTVVSLSGDQITTGVGPEIQVNDANVIATEVAKNGVVHYIDRLL